MRLLLETDRLVIKALDENYTENLLAFVSEGRDAFEKFETSKDASYYTHKFQQTILINEYNLMLERKYVRYYVFQKTDPNTIIGTISFSYFRPFPFSSCNIGYRFLPRFQGAGYAHESIAAAISEVFRSMNFHQIYAYIMPDNKSSIRLVEKLGFDCEGLSKKCLCVRGTWLDHYVYKLLNPIQ